nr:MAG TPA: hypothetical protein [Caudoviricetes sp.]
MISSLKLVLMVQKLHTGVIITGIILMLQNIVC